VVRSEEARLKELEQIEAYKDLADLVNSKVGLVYSATRYGF
jgi:hypothetical protein